MNSIGFKVSDDFKNEIRAIAQKYGTTMSNLIRAIIYQFIKEERENGDAQ